jgi:hypothetical protein
LISNMIWIRLRQALLSCARPLISSLLMLTVFITACVQSCFAQNPRLVIQPAARESIHARLDRDQLEELLYGTLGGSKQAFRRSKKESIQRYVDQVDQVCDLSDEQLAKIQNAIDVEIARWESRITALLSEITPSTEPTQKQTIFTQAWSKALSFQNETKENETTVWYKTLVSTLTPEQLEKLAADHEQMKVRERNVTRYRILLLAHRALGLTKSQREALNNLLENKANEPREEIRSLSQLYNFLATLNEATVALSDKQKERLDALAKGQLKDQAPDQFDINVVLP